MRRIIAVLVGFCCLSMFASVSMAASKETAKKTAKDVQLESSTAVKSQAGGDVDSLAARKKIGKNIKRSSEHGSVRGPINGGGDFI